MHTDAAHLTPASAYAKRLAELRIAALNTLADILATSDDPKEKRHAATAILRAPEPDEPQVLIRPPTPRPPLQPYSELPPRPSLQAPHPSPSPSLPPAIDLAEIERTAARARDFLAQSGIPLENDDNLSDLLGPPPTNESPAAHLARSAGQAPSG